MGLKWFIMQLCMSMDEYASLLRYTCVFNDNVQNNYGHEQCVFSFLLLVNKNTMCQYWISIKDAVL